MASEDITFPIFTIKNCKKKKLSWQEKILTPSPALSFTMAAGACCVTQVFQHCLSAPSSRLPGCKMPLPSWWPLKGSSAAPRPHPEREALRAPQLSKAPSWGHEKQMHTAGYAGPALLKPLLYSCCLYVDIGKTCFKFEYI